MINDQAVKLEPRDPISPFQLHPGNYRESHATPSPQPISPPMFVQVSPSPSPYQQQNNVGNILQNQLQGPSNSFHQPMFTPNISNAPILQVPNASNAIWTNAMGSEASSSKTYAFNNNFSNNNNMQTTASLIFSAPPPTNQNITSTSNYNITTNEPSLNSSILIDLDNQLFNNLSGDLQSLSFMDSFPMDSFSKTGEKLQSNK